MKSWGSRALIVVAAHRCLVLASHWPAQGPIIVDGVSTASPLLTFSTNWNSLGPFRLGTREAIWGADPLELYGGIQNISYDEVTCYHSPLAPGASVRWENQIFPANGSAEDANIELALDYPDIDWRFAQQTYGWAALQSQAWVKGEIRYAGDTPQRVLLYTDNILELWIGREHVFGGDFYSFQRAPLVVELAPGLTELNVRLLGDIRSMGGGFPPRLQASLRVKIIPKASDVAINHVLLPDVVGGQFNSPYGSVVIRNQARDWIKIEDVAGAKSLFGSLLADKEIWLAPGQSRPLRLDLHFQPGLEHAVGFCVTYTTNYGRRKQVDFDTPLIQANMTAPQKVTFLHPSGAVSYAILRPPSEAASLFNPGDLPVLVNLHGAGVEADSPMVRAMFEEAPDLPAWVLSPTGMSQWSGDDWHTWGFADVAAAIEMVPHWIQKMNWQGPHACVEKVLVAGHSNGGQGTWYFSTHQPDRVLAAAAASGYSSIENYVPFHLWQEADPLQSAIIQTARASFRHELLVHNLAGLAILQQHGSDDDNVPAYHSRLMNSLFAQAGQQVNYSELPGVGHWFDGAMTTPSMSEFYLSHLHCDIPAFPAPEQFSMIAPNSHDLGSRYGIHVDQLSTPDRMGRVDVVITETDSRVQWQLRTANIHRLHLEWGPGLSNTADEIVLDDMLHAFEVGRSNVSASFVKQSANLWAREVALDWRSPEQRSGRQRGGMDSILRSAGPFQLIYSSEDLIPLTVQTSRNFYQYYGADSNIRPWSQYEDALNGNSNIITFALGRTSLPARIPHFPITIEADQLKLTLKDGSQSAIAFSPGLGGIWLRPLSHERLELVVWGVDSIGVKQAARLIPTLTGAGQPDFVILDDSARWKGHGGAVAMGFFDYQWRISSGSYVP